MRRSELCGLQIHDVDLDRALVHVAFNYVVRGRQRVRKDTKTHQDRWLAIDPDTCAPPPAGHPGPPAGQPHPCPHNLAIAQVKVRCRAPTGTQFSCQPPYEMVARWQPRYASLHHARGRRRDDRAGRRDTSGRGRTRP